MKRIWIIIAVLLMLTGCNSAPKIQETQTENITASGIWASYSEVNSWLKSDRGFKAEFSDVILNLKKLKIQNLYLHVRPFCDSLYKSEYFPLMESVKEQDFDVLEYVISECHKNGIKLHAWINPYRVLTSSDDVEALDKNSPAYKWVSDQNTENDRNVCVSNGIYLNPAENDVRKLVIDGVREILENYKVDGIHFDDYFYPTTDEKFDKASFDEYIKDNASPMPIADWRRNNVNLLLSGCYDAVKSYNKDILFTISPTASIEQNYNNLYADVKEWINRGYIDYIIPQIYFGFEYPIEEFRFENLLDEWKMVTKGSNVGLIIGLACYKAKPELTADIEEWEENDDIISRQVEICYNEPQVKGYIYFSYSSLFSSEEEYAKQRESINNLEKING